MQSHLSLFSGTVLAVALGACSGSSATSNIQPSSPFTPELARVFDDSVDYVENVEDLGGRVASDWRRHVQGLAQHSDLIAVVRIETVTSGADASGARAYRLTATGRSPLRGRFPADGRVDLRVAEGEVGFNTVRGNESRLQAREYVLFAKWYADGTGAVRVHWHLSPTSASLLQRVRDAIGYIDPNAPRETVVRQN